MRRRWIVLALALGWAAGCRPDPPVTVEPLRLYVAPGLPGPLVAELARGFRIASPTLVPSVEEAEVAWLRSPSDALALGARAAPGSAPEQPRAPSEFLDPTRRYAPVGGIATVLVTSAKREAPFVPDALSRLADPRVRGRVAMVRLQRGDGPLLLAALELAYGERGTNGWLTQLAANEPILVDDAGEVIALVASGRADVGVVDSLTAGAAPPGELRLVFPDQKGGGTLVVPTALVVLPGAGGPARKFSAWLAGPGADEILGSRAAGLLPLREEATAPAGMLPVWKLGHLSPRWGDVATREAYWRRELEDWPRRWRKGR